MLSNKQKKSFKLIAIFSLFLSYITLIPFRTFGSSTMIHSIEVGVKLLFIPIVMVLLSIKANTIKYRELKVNRYRSKVVNVMSYFPLTVYLVSLLLFTIQTMTMSGEDKSAYAPLGLALWTALFVAIIIYACYLIIQMIWVNKVILNFNKHKLQIFDISFVVIAVFLIFISGCIVTAYFDSFKSFDFYRKGNVLLLIILVVGYLVAYFTGKGIKRSINEDEELLVANIGEINSGNPSELTKETEYQRALGDILNDFYNYYQNGNKTTTETPRNEEEEPQTQTVETTSDDVADQHLEEDLDTSNETDTQAEDDASNETIVPTESETLDEDEAQVEEEAQIEEASVEEKSEEITPSEITDVENEKKEN